jgi:hypothetical protein
MPLEEANKMFAHMRFGADAFVSYPLIKKGDTLIITPYSLYNSRPEKDTSSDDSRKHLKIEDLLTSDHSYHAKGMSGIDVFTGTSFEDSK